MAQFYSAKSRATARDVVTVTADDLDASGQGVARHQGKAVFVPGLLPQETAEVLITEQKRQFAHARLKRLITRSPQRVTPRCPHFAACGGCQQQHADIELQQQSKARALARLMQRPVDEIIAGPAWGYRRRARLALNFASRQQRLQMGFRMAASNELVDVHHCPVLEPSLEALLAPLRECLSGLQGVRRLGHVELVQADKGPLMVLRHLAPLSASDREKLERFSHSAQVSLFLAPQSDKIEQIIGAAPWYDVDGLRLFFSPRDFIQVNNAVNQQMVRQALNWLAITATDRVLDLFCGMGNFTLPLARISAQAVGVEGVAALVEKAQENAAANGLHNVSFWHENLEEDVTRQPWAAAGFNKVLLDPARAGAPGVMAQILRLAPERVVYVSCNLTTLARDSQTLLNGGYQVARLAMLDMFPHTGHLESMVLFEKCGDVQHPKR